MTKFDDDFDRITTAVMKKIPFIASLLRECRIIKTDLGGSPACTSPKGFICVDPDRLSGMSFRKTAFILAHEVLHCVNFHARRGKNKKDHLKWNYAADSVVNHLLKDLMTLPRWIITPKTIVNSFVEDAAAAEEVERMSDNEIYNLLVEHYDYEEAVAEVTEDGKYFSDSLPEVVGENPMYPSEDGDLSSEEKDGEIVQKGGDFNDAGDEEKRIQWKRNLTKAAMQQKMAGTMPAGLQRYVNGMLKSNLNIRSLIKQQIRSGFGNLVVNSWRRQGRKHPELPGERMLTMPTIWALCDTSGSITQEELKLFLGAIQEFASRTNVYVIPWDADTYEIIEVDRKEQVTTLVAKMLQGGGGTVIRPALSEVFNRMKSGDIVCVLTDGRIWDISEDETREYLSRVKRKASAAFLATTGQTIDSEWKQLVIRR